MKNSRGQALVVVLGIFVIFMIAIPAIIFMVQHETKWTVKQKKTTGAFQTAETGIDRGYWRMHENSSTWATVINGGVLPGYSGSEEYDVYSGSDTSKLLGKYRVLITPASTPGDILIRSVGRDADTNEVRAIELILTKANVQASLDINGGLTWKPNLRVHWGPVVSYTSISSPFRYFPRKYSIGPIYGIDSDPDPLNSDGKEYWAFEPLGNPPQVDLAYYKALAKHSVIPASSGGGTIRRATGSSAAVATPAGSGYFTSAANGSKIRFFGSYNFQNSTSVIYVEGGGMDFANSSFLDVQAALAEGDVDFNAGSQTFIATVPVHADLQYVKHKEMNSGYTFPGEGSVTFPIPSCGMHGFLYCGGDLSNAGGGSTMCGVAKVIGTVTMNTFTIYYDEAVASGIRLTDSKMYKKSWREVNATW